MLLGSQLVVTALIDHLTDQLQQHVVSRVLQPTLIIVLNTARPVDIVGGGVHTAAVPQLHLSVLVELRGQERARLAIRLQFVDHPTVDILGVLRAAVAKHQALHMKVGQQSGDEVCHSLDSQPWQHLYQLLLVPHLVTEQHTVVVDSVLVWLLSLEILQTPGVQLLEDLKSVGVHSEAGQLVHDLVQQDRLLVTVSLHSQRHPTLGVGQAVANARQLSRVGILIQLILEQCCKHVGQVGVMGVRVGDGRLQLDVDTVLGQ